MLIERLRQVELSCLRSMIRPLVRFCLRRTRTFQEFNELAREAFIDIAVENLEREGKKVNVSRLSLITGIHRRDVSRLYKEGGKAGETSLSLVGRVVSTWQTEDRFRTKSGKPLILSYQGDDSQFQQLVRSVDRHVNIGAVLFELERKNLIEQTKGGLRLRAAYVSYERNPEKGFELLGEGIDRFIRAVERNLLVEDQNSNLHIHTEYDNIYRSDVPAIQEWLIREGKRFHKRVREYLAQHDKDLTTITRQVNRPAGAQVSVIAFSFASQEEAE